MFVSMSAEETIDYMAGANIGIFHDTTLPAADDCLSSRTRVVINRSGVLDPIITLSKIVAQASIIYKSITLFQGKNSLDVRTKEMLLKVAITKLEQHAADLEKEHVVMYTDEPLLPEIFLDAGFKLRKATGSGEKFRASKSK